MAEHTVKVKTPPLEIGRMDLVFDVRKDGQHHGRLRISKGGVEWMQRFDNKKAFHMSWDKFDRVFSNEGDEGRTRQGKRRPAGRPNVKKTKLKFVRDIPDMGGPAPKAVREAIMRDAAAYVEVLMADFDKHSREYDAKAKKAKARKRTAKKRP